MNPKAPAPNVSWALSVACPKCHQPAGVACVRQPRSDPHVERLQAAEMKRLREWNRACASDSARTTARVVETRVVVDAQFLPSARMVDPRRVP